MMAKGVPWTSKYKLYYNNLRKMLKLTEERKNPQGLGIKMILIYFSKIKKQ